MLKPPKVKAKWKEKNINHVSDSPFQSIEEPHLIEHLNQSTIRVPFHLCPSFVIVTKRLFVPVSPAEFVTHGMTRQYEKTDVASDVYI